MTGPHGATGAAGVLVARGFVRPPCYRGTQTPDEAAMKPSQIATAVALALPQAVARHARGPRKTP